jgi:hypothetical protein
VWGGGRGGVRRVADSRSILTCYRAVCDETSVDFSYSLDSECSKSISFFDKVYVFCILSDCYISPGSYKNGV